MKREIWVHHKSRLLLLNLKKDVDVTLIKSLRPISLINIESKIASKALAARMKKTVHSLISYDQIAYIKGRYIGESVRVTDNLLKYAEDENIDVLLYSKTETRDLIG